MAETPTVGITAVDQLIQTALHRGLYFPPAVKRWQLLAWAAEALEARRINPAAWDRDGLREITTRHFPPPPA